MRPVLLILILVVALHFIGNAMGVYEQQIEAGFVWFDNVLHALVGLAVGLLWLAFLGKRRSERTVLFRASTALVFVLAVAMLWELVEFGFFKLFPTYAEQLNIYSPSLKEAFGDILSNVAGGLVLLLFMVLGTKKNAKMEVVQEPNELLHRKCAPVTDFGAAEGMARDLVETVRSVAHFWNRWLGFAANQIGYQYRIIVLRTGRDTFEVLINPEIAEKKFAFPYLETCYSVKGVYVVKRYLWAKVKYYDLQGNRREMILRGPNALYQEIDHINGILVSDIGVRLL